MLALNRHDLETLEADLVALAQLQHLGSAEDAWLSRLDLLKPASAVTVNDWTRGHRYHKGRNDQKVRFDFNLTPYVEGIQACADMSGVRVIGVQGNARSGKSVAAENIAMKRWAHGPYGDMLWYMQSGDDIDDYMEERGEWMLENHEQVAERVDTAYKRQARARKKIGENLARWLPATAKTTRGKGAPFIVADEIDAYQKKILAGLLTLLQNRQREFGSAALLYLASHPDAGPTAGISKIIADGIRHLWWWCCLHCGKPSSPAAEASVRMNWNMPQMYPMLKGVERTDAIEYARQHVRLICPHCKGEHTDAQRKVMSRETGAWVQPGQHMIGPKRVEGEYLVDEIMGFVIHAFMAPFVRLRDAAPAWYSAMRTFEEQHDDEPLRQVTVKTLGEVMDAAAEDQKIDTWAVIRTRMQSGGTYFKRTVPPGVDFIVAFVDIQKRGFEVRVIGYSALGKESWLIDAYLLGQHMEPGRANEPIDPFTVLSDWSVLEQGVLQQSYPLFGDPLMHMPIAAIGVDTGGLDDTTVNARKWAASVIHRTADPIPDWRIKLIKGSSKRTGEHLYGKPKQVTTDDQGKALSGAVWERTAIVYQIKKIIRRRQNIQLPGPGFMHAPIDLEEKYFREVVAEKLIGGEWVREGDNETWDAYVGCETVRDSLSPDRPDLNWSKPPSWARPFRPGVDAGIDTKPRTAVSPYARMLRINHVGTSDDA
jgi:phage terminase large subunit GpA-like protein